MKVFVTRKIPGGAIEKLKTSGIDLAVSEIDDISVQEFLAEAKGVDGLITFLTDRVDGDLMDAVGPQLKVIANYAVGFDNIDIQAATERGIVVANTPSDEVNEAVAEHTWALILALARRIVESDEFVRREGYFADSLGYRGWEPGLFLGTNLIGKTLGIIGLGRIGSMVARRAQGYNMRIIYNKRSRDLECEEKMGVEYCDLDTLLSESDFVTLHVPLTEETRHMIDKNAFSKMKRGSFLINTARGAVVSEEDLVEFLKNGYLAGAALDVFEHEPNISPDLIAMPNVILTPHIASATHEARDKMGQQVIDAILDVFAGKKPENIVNSEVWEKRR